jgi:hypothetical protein
VRLFPACVVAFGLLAVCGCEERQEPYLALELTSPVHKPVGFIGEYGRDGWESFAGTTPKTIVFHPWHVGTSGKPLQVGARKTTDDRDMLRLRVFRNDEVIAESSTASIRQHIVILLD